MITNQLGDNVLKNTCGQAQSVKSTEKGSLPSVHDTFPMYQKHSLRMQMIVIRMIYNHIYVCVALEEHIKIW